VLRIVRHGLPCSREPAVRRQCRLLAVSKLCTQKQRSLEVTTSAAVASCCISESITGVWTSAAFTERCHWQPLARGRRRGRQGTTATVSRPVTMSRSPRQHQSTRAASGNPPAQSSHGSVTFVTVARGGLRLCYGGYSYTKKAEKKNRIRWECSQRKPQQCKGAVTTSLVVRFTYVYRHSDYRYVKRHTAL